MRILLSDGAGLTARQVATLLSRAGHHVEVVSPDPMCVCRFTRHVRRVNRVPAYGADPFGWLAAALAVVRERRIDVLLPTQDQVAVLAAAPARLRAAGVRTAVPAFAALSQVQDKLAAHATMTRAGLPQPVTRLVTGPDELRAVDDPPVFVKTPIGTASSGVALARDAADLRELAARHDRDGTFAAEGGVLVQRPAQGPFVMVQSVFAAGEHVAFHACRRVREGARGGASHKESLRLPDVAAHMRALGRALGWHGALSADVILSPDGPLFIDINPRLVEPVNADQAGVDLVGALLDIAGTGMTAPHPEGRPGVRTHQLPLAILGAAQHGGRRDVARELWRAAARRGAYRGGVEELTPLRGDPLALLPAAAAAVATLARPRTWEHFTGGSVRAYALTPSAWHEIRTRTGDLPEEDLSGTAGGSP